MKRTRYILIVVILTASLAGAQNLGGTASRQAYLWRALDSWSLNISQAVVMREDPFASARAQAVNVMASNVDSKRLMLLSHYLGDTDALVREQVMLTMGRLGEPGLGLAVHGLDDAASRVRQAAVWAVAHGGPGAFKPLERHLEKERSREVLETLLANFWRVEGAAWQPLVAPYAESDDVYLRRAAAYSLSRTGDESARAAQRRLSADPEPVIRATVLRGFERGSLKKEDIAVVQVALTDADWRVRAAACRVLAAHDRVDLSAGAKKAVADAFASPHPHLAVSALAAASRQPGVGDKNQLMSIADGEDPWLAAEALSALTTRDPSEASKLMQLWFDAEELWRRRAAARASVDLGMDAEKLAVADADASVRLSWLASLDDDAVRDRSEILAKILDEDPDPAVRAQTLSMLRSVGIAPDFEELVGFYAEWKREAMPDARAEALVAAVAAGENKADQAAAIALGLTDSDPVVAAMVINGARSLDLEALLPAREPRHGIRWYEELVEWVQDPRWLDVSTQRGSFRIRLDLAAAPLTSREVSDLAAAGFYDGLEFHRVVPNFVVQGGDPRGDGWGGPGLAFPDEPSLVPFDSWRVGVATSGPETGGSQLFVTLLPADHLTGHYTNLGEVVDGREVLTQLRVGDKIITITPHGGADPPPLASEKFAENR
jgi:cyclophilin family peptidyl-prolyl cis-trans isomerase/HEAT repeat protein